MSGIILKRESDALQQILGGVTHRLINPSRLTGIKEGTKFGTEDWGVVYLAMLDGSSKVLVKRLQIIQLSGALDMVRMATRFAIKLKALANANHPNILKLIGYHLEKNYSKARLVFPYMANGNISEYIYRDQTSVEVRLSFVRGIASGLAYLHSCDPPICHGNLKPANVLINDEPDAILSDFGMNTSVEDDYYMSALSPKPSNYTSPELLQNAEPEPTLQGDVWAWACTTFQIITNCVPYSTANGVNGILSALAQGEPPGRVEQLHGLIHESNKQFYESLEILRSAFPDCWSLNPSDRPPISLIMQGLSSLPPAKSLLLEQQAAGRVERNHQIVGQLAREIKFESLLNGRQGLGVPQIEVVICPPNQGPPPLCIRY